MVESAALAIALLPIAVLAIAWLSVAATDSGDLLAEALPSVRALRLLGNSLALAAGATALATVLGGGLAVWLYATDGPLARLLRQTYLLPLLIPTHVHALAWMSVAGRRQVLDQLASLLVGADRVAVSAYGLLPATLVLGLALMPVVTLLALAGLEAIDPELLEEGLLLRPSWPVGRHVLLPLAAPSILGGAGLVFVLALVEYGVPSALQHNVYSMEIYARFSQDADPIRALSSSLPLLVPAMVVLAVSQTCASRGRSALRGGGRRSIRLDVSRWPFSARLVTSAGVAAILLAAAGPVLVLIARTGSPAAMAHAAALAPREIALTLGVAAASASIAALLALPAASAIDTRADSALLWLLLVLPLAIPAPVAGIALVFATNGPWLDWAQGTPLVLCLAHVVRLLPFAVFAVAAQVQRVDPALVEAAVIHDVGAWRRLWRVRLPLLAPAVVVAWLVVFVFSLGELGTSLLVIPPGQATLPIRVYNLMHYGATETVAALSLIALGAAGAAGLGAHGVRRTLWPWAK